MTHANFVFLRVLLWVLHPSLLTCPSLNRRFHRQAVSTPIDQRLNLRIDFTLLLHSPNNQFRFLKVNALYIKGRSSVA